MASRAEDVADGVDRLLAAARLMLETRPYAAVEGAASILTEAHALSALSADEPVARDQAIEVLRRRRGLEHVPRTGDRPLPIEWDESDPVSIITTAVERIIRAAHTFDLLNGRDSSVITVMDAARVIDRANRGDDSFELATEVVDEFHRRGGVAALFVSRDIRDERG